MAIENPTQFINQRFTDFEDFCDRINGWNLDFKQLAASTGDHQLLQLSTPGLAITRTLINSSFYQQGSTPSSMRTFCLLADTVAPPTWCHWPIDADSLIINPRHGEFNGSSQPGFHLLTFSIEEEQLRETAELQFGSNWDKLVDDSGTVVQLNTANIDKLRHTVNTLCKELVLTPSNYQRLNYPYYSEVLAEQLLAAMLASKPITLSKPEKKRSAYLSRALDYMEVNYDEMISMKQLCTVSGASQRTLEYVFQEKLQTTPKHFLVAQKLHAVRQQLRKPKTLNPPKIVDIANQHGFWHLGQFAKDYRALYGELPNETLKRKY